MLKWPAGLAGGFIIPTGLGIASLTSAYLPQPEVPESRRTSNFKANGVGFQD
jgi:hypothetical protein